MRRGSSRTPPLPDPGLRPGPGWGLRPHTPAGAPPLNPAPQTPEGLGVGHHRPCTARSSIAGGAEGAASPPLGRALLDCRRGLDFANPERGGGAVGPVGGAGAGPPGRGPGPYIYGAAAVERGVGRKSTAPQIHVSVRNPTPATPPLRRMAAPRRSHVPTAERRQGPQPSGEQGTGSGPGPPAGSRQSTGGGGGAGVGAWTFRIFVAPISGPPHVSGHRRQKYTSPGPCPGGPAPGTQDQPQAHLPRSLRLVVFAP